MRKLDSYQRFLQTKTTILFHRKYGGKIPIYDYKREEISIFLDHFLNNLESFKRWLHAGISSKYDLRTVNGVSIWQDHTTVTISSHDEIQKIVIMEKGFLIQRAWLMDTGSSSVIIAMMYTTEIIAGQYSLVRM